MRIRRGPAGLDPVIGPQRIELLGFLLVVRRAGGDLAAIKIATTAAQQGATAGEAAAGIPNATWQAMETYFRGRNTGSWWTKRSAATEAETTAALDRLAGGATATESRAVQEQSKRALDAITTPMRETELAAAGTAGRMLPGLQATEARFAEAAAGKVDDVRRLTASVDNALEWANTWAPSARGGAAAPFGQPRVPARYTYPGELAVKAEQAAGESADASDRKSTRLNSSHSQQSRMPSSA